MKHVHLFTALILSLSIAGCATRSETGQRVLRDKQVAYQRKQFEPRIDELLTQPHSEEANRLAGREIAERTTMRPGEPVTIQGLIVATDSSSSGGALDGSYDGIGIETGDYTFSVPVTTQANKELRPHVGREVQVGGVITDVLTNSLVVDVSNYRLLQ